MDPTSELLMWVVILFVLVTVPLLAVAVRLKHVVRALLRIESMNVQSLQRWR